MFSSLGNLRLARATLTRSVEPDTKNNLELFRAALQFKKKMLSQRLFPKIDPKKFKIYGGYQDKDYFYQRVGQRFKETQRVRELNTDEDKVSFMEYDKSMMSQDLSILRKDFTRKVTESEKFSTPKNDKKKIVVRKNTRSRSRNLPRSNSQKKRKGFGKRTNSRSVKKSGSRKKSKKKKPRVPVLKKKNQEKIELDQSRLSSSRKGSFMARVIDEEMKYEEELGKPRGEFPIRKLPSNFELNSPINKTTYEKYKGVDLDFLEDENSEINLDDRLDGIKKVGEKNKRNLRDVKGGKIKKKKEQIINSGISNYVVRLKTEDDREYREDIEEGNSPLQNDFIKKNFQSLKEESEKKKDFDDEVLDDSFLIKESKTERELLETMKKTYSRKPSQVSRILDEESLKKNNEEKKIEEIGNILPESVKQAEEVMSEVSQSQKLGSLEVSPDSVLEPQVMPSQIPSQYESKKTDEEVEEKMQFEGNLMMKKKGKDAIVVKGFLEESKEKDGIVNKEGNEASRNNSKKNSDGEKEENKELRNFSEEFKEDSNREKEKNSLLYSQSISKEGSRSKYSTRRNERKAKKFTLKVEEAVYLQRKESLKDHLAHTERSPEGHFEARRKTEAMTERNLEKVKILNKNQPRLKALFDAESYYKLGQNVPLLSDEEDPDESIYNKILSSSMKYEETLQTENDVKSSFVLLESSRKNYKNKNILGVKKKTSYVNEDEWGMRIAQSHERSLEREKAKNMIDLEDHEFINLNSPLKDSSPETDQNKTIFSKIRNTKRMRKNNFVHVPKNLENLVTERSKKKRLEKLIGVRDSKRRRWSRSKSKESKSPKYKFKNRVKKSVKTKVGLCALHSNELVNYYREVLNKGRRDFVEHSRYQNMVKKFEYL